MTVRMRKINCTNEEKAVRLTANSYCTIYLFFNDKADYFVSYKSGEVPNGNEVLKFVTNRQTDQVKLNIPQYDINKGLTLYFYAQNGSGNSYDIYLMITARDTISITEL